MKKIGKILLGINILLALYHLYFTLFNQPKLILTIYLPVLAIALLVYFTVNLFLHKFKHLEKHPFLQTLMIYLIGITFACFATMLSSGFTLTNFLATLRTNLLALPLFIPIFIYWQSYRKSLNRQLLNTQNKLKGVFTNDK
ncbi:hypothetical protein [Isobaculum melis]|uniref:Uncharacterized protein n=1 Tax=Isobaculum melis TaxID=142588 RepID=A0A1H9UK25_9LACT|nr:hypothetical protein [Isobaculum melis]SES09795.1 hypothetical protein SAMN04488559_1357 [Isobaculum melis]